MNEQKLNLVEEINQAAHMVAGDRNDVFVKAAVNFLKNNISG